MPPPADASQVVAASSSCMRATSPWIFCAAAMRPSRSGSLKSDIGLDLLDAGTEGVEHHLGEWMLARLRAPALALLATAIGLGLDERASRIDGDSVGGGENADGKRHRRADMAAQKRAQRLHIARLGGEITGD